MHVTGAPRDAVLNPWRSQEELGGMFLGHRVNLKAKAGGDKSMPEKRESLEGAERVEPDVGAPLIPFNDRVGHRLAGRRWRAAKRERLTPGSAAL